MIELPEPLREALAAPNFWHFATVNPDGSPQITTMWIDLRDDHILINSALGRKKHRNLGRNPLVACSWHDPNQPQTFGTVQGRVVDSYVGERANADINGLAHKYTGKDYSFVEGQVRITYLIEPLHATWRPAPLDRL